MKLDTPQSPICEKIASHGQVIIGSNNGFIALNLPHIFFFVWITAFVIHNHNLICAHNEQIDTIDSVVFQKRNFAL